MKVELLCQQNCFACLMPQKFGILKQGKRTFGLDLKQHCLQRDQERSYDYWTEN